jgi:hypothetical protein
MRHTLSAATLLLAVVASVATSTTTPPIAAVDLQRPTAELQAGDHQRLLFEVTATQSPEGRFDGALLVSGDVRATVGSARLDTTLSVLDGRGATELAHDSATAAPGADGRLFLFDDVDAFAGCADGAECTLTFELLVDTDGRATVDLTVTAELYDLADAGRQGSVQVRELPAG